MDFHKPCLDSQQKYQKRNQYLVSPTYLMDPKTNPLLVKETKMANPAIQRYLKLWLPRGGAEIETSCVWAAQNSRIPYGVIMVVCLSIAANRCIRK